MAVPQFPRDLTRPGTRIGLAEMPVPPVHFESAIWAFRRGLAYSGRIDQQTLAQEIRPQ